MYRVNRQVSVLGWVDFDLDVPLILPSCSAHSAHLYQPKQNRADRGTAKIKVNPTQVQDLLGHPVLNGVPKNTSSVS